MEKDARLSAGTAEALYSDGHIEDIRVRRNGRDLLMLGAAGSARELRCLPAEFPGQAGVQNVLPVLIGSGTGRALEELAARLEDAFGPDFLLAVIDREEDILAVNGVRERFAGKKGIFWPVASSHRPCADDTLKALTMWQNEHGGKAFLPVLNPFYLRLDREYYAAVKSACDASAQIDFWNRAHYAKLQNSLPRILLLTSTYFLMGEIEAACIRLGLPHRLLQLPRVEYGQDEFVRTLLTEVTDFRPDFIFTINHLGMDREGVLAELLERLRLPLASWFVDNPHLILYMYSQLLNPWTAIFSWDVDNLASLRDYGFERVAYLPLGTDVHRFLPPDHTPGWSGLPDPPKAWNGEVAFVGNSMHSKVAARIERTSFPPELLAGYQDIAAGFAATDERFVRAYLMRNHPALLPCFDGLESVEVKLSYEAMITWEATRQYRLSCVEGILPFAPLIVGDSGWKDIFAERDAARGFKASWHYCPEVGYYDELPRLYPRAAVNFNCTSKQMKGAVNQRVFDVPATGAFLLTDYREQVENLFEPGREIICYRSPEEAGDLARYYLAHPEARLAVSAAARRRILNEHSYEHRLRSLIAGMREFFG
ncbi:MAG: glycosyltransferase [Desulfovibrio sp.]|jgi:spore maturation protein CgeB|nr:glycosyltransferase [Desulfovibrio sp.]